MGFDLDNLADCAMCILDTGLIILVDLKKTKRGKRMKNTKSTSFTYLLLCTERCKKDDAILFHNIICCFLISRVLSSNLLAPCCRVKVISPNFR